MSLLAKQRSAIINDLENAQSSSSNSLCPKKRASFHRAEEVQVNTHPKDDLVELDEELAVEKALFKAHLRRLRNFYGVLAEVCQRDEKLLAI
jgi:hypothetical protein